MKKLLIFASGSKDGGGSGFEKLILAQKEGKLRADIAAVVSNHEHGGVRKHADNYGIPFIHFPKPWTAEMYQKIVANTGAEFVALSGWLKLTQSLDPRTTFNIHPGPLPAFGGPGRYGHYVHEEVMKAYQKGEVLYSAVSMHFVTDEYDKGPVFFSWPIRIEESDTPETLAKKVNKEEHAWQWRITDMVVNGEISWDGKNPETLTGKILIFPN